MDRTHGRDANVEYVVDGCTEDEAWDGFAHGTWSDRTVLETPDWSVKSVKENR